MNFTMPLKDLGRRRFGRILYPDHPYVPRGKGLFHKPCPDGAGLGRGWGGADSIKDTSRAAEVDRIAEIP